MQHLLVGSPYTARFGNVLLHRAPSKAAERRPHLQLPARSSAGCVAPCLRAACQVHSCDPSSVGCSHYGELRAWPTGERVLLELSGDEGAKNCCGSPSPSGPTICASGLGIPSRPWIIFRTDGEGLPDHLACGSAEAAQENHSRNILEQTDAPDLCDRDLGMWTQPSAGDPDGHLLRAESSSSEWHTVGLGHSPPLRGQHTEFQFSLM